MENDPKVQEIFQELKKMPRTFKERAGVTRKEKIFWDKVFERLRHHNAIPEYQRLNELENAINDPNLIRRLAYIYNVYQHEDISDFSKDQPMDIYPVKCPFYKVSTGRDFVNFNIHSKFFLSSTTIRMSNETDQNSVAAPSVRTRFHDSVIVNYRRELMKSKDDAIDEDATMYEKFMKRSDAKANRWRPKPPVTFQGMTLSAKCDAVIRDIATNFVNWMNSLGGDSKTLLAAEDIEALFEIGFDNHASDSLAINVEELNSVTEAVARSRQVNEASYSTQLYKQLHRDMMSVKSKEANFAFGTMLPPEMRAGTTHDSTVSKWITNQRVPQRLATMAVVWEGIETLKSTEGYCVWLQESDIPPPTYLTKKGLLKAKKYELGERSSQPDSGFSRFSTKASIFSIK